VFVARDTAGNSASFVNALVAETEEEKALIQRGDESKVQMRTVLPVLSYRNFTVIFYAI